MIQFLNLMSSNSNYGKKQESGECSAGYLPGYSRNTHKKVQIKLELSQGFCRQEKKVVVRV